MRVAIMRKWLMGFLVVKLLVLFFLLVIPRVWAAEEALSAEVLEQIRQEIAAVSQEDPELAAVMKEQLEKLESGEVPAREFGLDHPTFDHPTDMALGAPPVDGILPVPVVDANGGPLPLGDKGEDYLPPDVREQLQKLFEEKGTGDPAKDEAVRREAEQILRDNGIDPHEIGPGHDQEGDWKEHGGVEYPTTSPREAFEQWKELDDARNVPEAVIKEYERQADDYQRDYEQHQQEYEQHQREFEIPTQETTHEQEHEYEAPSHEVLAPERELETPVHETPEAPVHEYEQPAYEAPQHDEYEMPQPPQGDTPPQG